MAEAIKKLAQQALTGSPTQDTVYTVPGSTEAMIKKMTIVNFSGSNATVQMWHDGTADANRVLPTVTILAGGWGEWTGAWMLEAGDTLVFEGSAASTFTVTIYGIEFS